MPEEPPQNLEGQNLNEVAARYDRTVVEPGGAVIFDIDNMEINGPGVEDLRFGLDILLQFTNLPIVTDEFKSHEERTLFRNKLSVENLTHYNILENNKLRGNMIATVEQGFSLIGEGADSTDIPQSMKEEIKTLVNACPQYNVESYDAMTNEEKIRYVKQLDKMILTMFELLNGHQKKQ